MEPTAFVPAGFVKKPDEQKKRSSGLSLVKIRETVFFSVFQPVSGIKEIQLSSQKQDADTYIKPEH